MVGLNYFQHYAFEQFYYPKKSTVDKLHYVYRNEYRILLMQRPIIKFHPYENRQDHELATSIHLVKIQTKILQTPLGSNSSH